MVVSLQSPAQAVQQPPAFAARTDLVLLSATAHDRRGRPVTDLRSDEFQIFDEGRPVQLDFFSSGSGEPARVLFLIDASGSMSGQDKSASTRMVAVQVLSALDPRDEVAVAGFDHRYFGLARFTRDRAEALRAFDSLEFFGSTALHDAIGSAAAEVATLGPGRRAVLVLTDGVDTTSAATPDQVLARARALDVPIYAVSVVSPLDDPSSPRYLRGSRPARATRGAAELARYAALSGGQAFAVSDFAGLRKASLEIAAQLEHQYRLGYDPPVAAAGFRRLDVRVTRRGVSVRTRSGYLARP